MLNAHVDMSSSADSCEAAHRHEAIKSSPLAFASGTVRLPHRPNVEAYQDDGAGGLLWLRNCACCKSTLAFYVGARQ